MAINFTFSENHFNRIFPFYILINQQMVIESIGTSLEKFYSGTSGKLFSENYIIKRPYLTEIDFQTLKSHTNQMLVIECFNDHQTNLRGQIDYLPETNQLLFMGTPWFATIEDVINNDLSLNDFAYHDSMTDLLHVLKTQEISNDDLKHLLQTVNFQKERLKEANKEINESALFTNQNPDPLIRIDFNGEILRNNPSAAKLDFFIYEETIYRNDELFKLIASKIDINCDRWEFEANSGNLDYSLACIPMKEEGYINIYGRDITQIKKDQLQLKHLSLIIQQMNKPVLITDANSQIVWLNDSFERVTGYSLTEVKGKNIGILMEGKDTDPETIKYIQRQSRKPRPFNYEIFNYRKSKEGYWLRINAHPLLDKNGNLIQFFSIWEDITSEKESQEKIQEANNRMFSLISNLQAGVLLVNEQGKVDLVNHRFCEIFNISDDPSVLIGSESVKTIDLAKPFFKNPELFASNINFYKEEKKLIIGEIIEMNDGRFFERDLIPIWNEEKYNGNLWVYTEITEKINADKNLADQKSFYEEILDNIPADIAVFDNQHNYMFVNPKGISDPALRKWLIGKKDEDYVQYRNKPLSMIEDRRKQFNEVMNSKVLNIWEEEVKEPDGSSHYILRHMYPVLNKKDQVKLIIGYGVDITYTKSVLLQIEESEKRYRDVIENSLALITTHDMNGIILTANPIVGKTYGYRDDELIGHNFSEFMPEKDRPLINKDYLLNIKKEKKQSGIFKIIGKNGEIIYTLYNNFLKEEPGKEPYVIGFSVDITNRIKAEKELKKAKKITEELAQTRQNFLAHMSHEIRTPMNAVMGMTNQLSKTLLNKDQQYFVEIIKGASTNLLSIINEILDLSKIEAGKLSLEHIAFEPKFVIGQVMQVMMHKAEEKGLLFSNSFCDIKLAEVLNGDPYRLNQILLNLVSNAIKFTDKGSVDISCVVIDETELQQTVSVTIKDTGIGMAESFSKNLFKKYSQEEGSISRIYGGTGLGMSICEELIHLMGGTINVESKKGLGTTVSFVITFDKGTKGQLPIKEIIKLDTSILKGKKVLITDDYEINRLLASTILTNYNVITEEAKNGIEAIEKIEKEKFDLVLMDVQMPEMDGLEATHYIRSKISKTLPIIALTAYALKGDDAKFMEAGMDDYLSKPFEENQLVEVLIKWIKKTEINTPLELKKSKVAPLYDLTKIQNIAKGNAVFVNKLIALFIENTPVSVLDMKMAYANNDFEKVKKIAHRIKPSIDNLEILSIKNEVREIELNAESYKTSEQLGNLILKVEQVMNEVVASLNSIDYTI